MRILHTADWHLCHKLGNLNRTDELRRRVERVAELCEEHRVDLLLIAGDLFAETSLGQRQITESLRHIHQTFKPFFARGGTILAITGNHDNDQHIDLARAGLTLASPIGSRDLTAGRMYIQNGLNFCKLRGPTGEVVQFVLVPYPQSARYDLPQGYRTREEERRKLREKLSEWMRNVFDKEGFDQSLPSVLMAHFHIQGASLTRLYKLNEADDVLIDSAEMKSGWTYVALGHIHQPQEIGAKHIRYPGPLDRLDFNEIKDDRGVLLLDIKANGLAGDPQWLPIPPTPMYDVHLPNPDLDLEKFLAENPDYSKAIVRVTVETEPQSMSRLEYRRKLDELFFHVHELTWNINIVEAVPSELRASVETAGHSLGEVVRNYMNDQLKDDAERDSVLALCECYLQEFESGVKS